MKRYEKYIEVDSRWAKCIPVSWTFSKIAEVFIERKENNDPVKTTEILSLTNTRGVIPYKEKGNIGNKAKEDLTGYRLAYPGDIVFNSMNAVIGSVGLSKYFGAVSPVYYMLYLRDAVTNSIRFFDYVFQDKMFQSGLNGLGNGILEIRMRIPMSKLKYVGVPVPPRAEQDQIVRYLDWQVSKINRLIAAKQHQIELLEQKKMRSIQTAFCKNRSHHSVEDLLGTIKEWLPDGWSSPLLGQVISSIEQGWSPNAGDDIDDPNQWHVLTLSAVKHGSFVKTACKPIDINATIPIYLELKDGDLLLTRSNTRNLVGDVCVVHDADPQTIFSDLIYRLVVKLEYALPRYLMYYLLSPFARIQIERAAKGSSGTMPKLSHADIRRIRLVLPPVETQESICNELDAISGIINAEIDKIKTQINHILELRTRLIFDVVTGQIDVRGIEVPEYEFVEDTDTREEPEEDTEGEDYEE